MKECFDPNCQTSIAFVQNEISENYCYCDFEKMVEMMEYGYAKIYFKIDGFLGRKEESIVMENGEI